MKQTTSYIENLGARIQAIRKKNGLSLRELARRADLSVSFLSRIESDGSVPTVMTLQKLCYALKIDLVDFLTNNGSIERKRKYIFKRSEMKPVEGEGRHWFFTFPHDEFYKVSQTYEEYEPHTGVLEKEKHPMDLFGFVVSGQLTLEIDNEKLKVEAGDAFYVPANTQHVSSNQSDEILKMIVGRVKE